MQRSRIEELRVSSQLEPAEGNLLLEALLTACARLACAIGSYKVSATRSAQTTKDSAIERIFQQLDLKHDLTNNTFMISSENYKVF